MFESLGRIVGGVLRLMVFFLTVAVVMNYLAPEAMMQIRQLRPPDRQGIMADDATPRRPARTEEEEVLPPGQLFSVADPEPGNSLGTAFKVGADTLWLTANHVVSQCDRVGLDAGPFHAATVRPGHSLPEADVAAIRLSARVSRSLPLATSLPRPGDAGYHMGFPRGHRAVVVSRYMGEAQAAVGTRKRSPVLVWAERQRLPAFSGTLAGISGGPALNARGRLIGINIAVSERRGRILTAHPDAIAAVLAAEKALAASRTDGQAAPKEALNPSNAPYLARALERTGAMRRVHCQVE